MNSSKYGRHIKKLLESTKIDQSDVLDYSHQPLENVYEQLFLFCEENIDRFSINFNIQPAYFFYKNTTKVNAGASFRDNSYVIFMTQGLIVRLNKKLGRNRQFIQNSKFSELKKLQNELTDDLGHLMFQCSMIFIFYHEFAHLVQQKKETDFNFERHVCEYDADRAGALFVSMYIQQYYTEQLKENLKTKDNFNNLMYLGITSIIITFILFSNGELNNEKATLNGLEFYTKETTHPHTFVRLNYILKQYIHTAKSNYATIGTQDTLSKVSQISHEFFNDTGAFKNFATNFNQNIDEINKYDMELNLASQKMKNLIRHKIDLFKLE